MVDLRALLEQLDMLSFEDLLPPHEMQQWANLTRLELLDTLKRSGLPLAQRQKLANALFKARRAEQQRLPDPPDPLVASLTPDRSAAAQERHEILYGRMGACAPNAPIPRVPPPPPPPPPPPAEPAEAAAAPPAVGRVFCVSDLHTDHLANMEWCGALLAAARRGEHKADALLVAGDVSSRHEILRQTLRTLREAFGHVFYTPGNHDLWVRGAVASANIRTKPIDSLRRLSEITRLCDSLGVHTGPAYAAGAIVAPLYAWYHSSFDTEPEIVGWEGIPSSASILNDFVLCDWPEPLSTSDDSIAIHFDSLNDSEAIKALQEKHPSAPLITFSHFVPLLELNPEKRFLFFPPLAKAIGSNYLGARIKALKPAVHIFGHTHFGWDSTVGGVRYVQAPLSYPQERSGRLGTVATGEFPHGSPPTPLLIYDATNRSFPPRYDAGWSNYYARYPRRADLCHLLAPYVASQYKQVQGVGQVGWLKDGDNPDGSATGHPVPAWALGPASATEFEERQRLAGKNLAKNR
ncbi:hypothetical protein AB1Y20_021736 [Prymnesium parvum]|uniref:Calcineurin-like phosphoesterase domain-containing protein n=1 Tax=Prymnesium parvum TaxID=97485 RepID=A0AB34JKB3_PRYPA